MSFRFFDLYSFYWGLFTWQAGLKALMIKYINETTHFWVFLHLSGSVFNDPMKTATRGVPSTTL